MAFAMARDGAWVGEAVVARASSDNLFYEVRWMAGSVGLGVAINKCVCVCMCVATLRQGTVVRQGKTARRFAVAFADGRIEEDAVRGVAHVRTLGASRQRLLVRCA
jgi:hypothetical protein